jgi:hypothetical protein
MKQKITIKFTDVNGVVTVLTRESGDLCHLEDTLQFFEDAIRGPLGFVIDSYDKLTFAPEGEL